MIWKDYSRLQGRHALLSPSSPRWKDKTDEELEAQILNSDATARGTALHNAARICIENDILLNENDHNLLKFVLAQNGFEFGLLDIDYILTNIRAYVNDAIDYHMNAEQVLCYSEDICFGTADAISFNRRKLRIHDLKTGETPAHMEQLEIYAALFCLDYKKDPKDISIELRIYQSCKVLVHQPDPKDIQEVMSKIIHATKIAERIKGVNSNV